MIISAASKNVKHILHLIKIPDPLGFDSDIKTKQPNHLVELFLAGATKKIFSAVLRMTSNSCIIVSF